MPVRLADRITITFNEKVNVTEGDLTLASALVDGPDPGAVVEFTPVMDTATDTYTATWRFEEFEANQMVLTLSDNITDATGTPLDGDWTNPDNIWHENTSDFPSGNGTPGWDFVFRFTILPGDLNRNNIVGAADFEILVGNHGTAGGFVDGDLNGDGFVTADDVTDYDYIILSESYGRIWIIWEWDLVLGDMNHDGVVNGLDVAPFVARVLSGQFMFQADINEDGDVNGLDVEYFADMVLYGAPQF